MCFPQISLSSKIKENRVWVHPGGGFSYTIKRRINSDLSIMNLCSKLDVFQHAAFGICRPARKSVATRSCGLEKVSFLWFQIKTIHVNSNIHSTVNNDVRPIFQDSEKNIWIATKDEKIHIYDQNMQKKGILTEDGIIGEGPSLAGSAYCIMEDSKKNIWIGTKGKGVYKLIRKKNPNTFEIHPIQHNPHNPFSLSNIIFIPFWRQK